MAWLPVSAMPFGNPFAYPAYDLVTGAPIDTLPYTGVTFGAPQNLPGTWQGSLPLVSMLDPATRQPRYDYARATKTTTTALFVDLLGTLIWGGVIWSTDYDSADPQKLLKVSAMEFGSYFQARLQALDYSATWAAGADPMAIAQTVLADAQAKGTVMGGITVTLHPPGGEGGPKVAPSYPGTSLQTIDSIVSILSQMGYTAGFDYSFDAAYLPGTRTPGVTLNLWYPRQGRPYSSSQIVISARDCTFTYPVDGTQRATSIVETGSGQGSMTPATASVVLPGVPLLERAIARSQINDEGTLANVTFGDLGLYCNPVVSPTFTIPVTTPDAAGQIAASAVLPFGTFDRGDDFLFRVDPVAGGGENTDPRFPDGCEFEFRINQWQCTVADSGLSTLLVSAGVPPLASIPPPTPPL